MSHNVHVDICQNLTFWICRPVRCVNTEALTSKRNIPFWLDPSLLRCSVHVRDHIDVEQTSQWSLAYHPHSQGRKHLWSSLEHADSSGLQFVDRSDWSDRSNTLHQSRKSIHCLEKKWTMCVVSKVIAYTNIKHHISASLVRNTDFTESRAHTLILHQYCHVRNTALTSVRKARNEVASPSSSHDASRRKTEEKAEWFDHWVWRAFSESEREQDLPNRASSWYNRYRFLMQNHPCSLYISSIDRRTG